MESTITDKQKENFWIFLYLSRNNDFLDAAIRRAYRDFIRTAHGISEKQSATKRDEIISRFREIISEVQKRRFDSQQSFDLWHEEACNKLIKIYEKNLSFSLKIGQAQKWINMTLKYLFVLGEDRIKGATNNYQFFHIPIDNIIQENLKNKYEIQPVPGTWSGISDYNTYMNYQKQVRATFPGEIPMDVEFRVFMEP